MQQLLAYLGNYGTLSPALLQELHSILKHKIFRKKEHLLRAGQTGQYIYFIIDGAVRTYTIKGCKEISGWFLLPNDVQITIESYQRREPACQNVQAIKETEVMYVSYAELRHLIEHYPEFKTIFLERVLHYYALLAKKYFEDSLLTPEQRYLQLIARHPDWLEQIPVKYLASFIGVSGPYLSKLRKKLD